MTERRAEGAAGTSRTTGTGANPRNPSPLFKPFQFDIRAGNPARGLGFPAQVEARKDSCAPTKGLIKNCSANRPSQLKSLLTLFFGDI